MSTDKQTSADYKNLIDLLSVFSEAKRRLAELENDAQSEFTQIVDDMRSDYSTAQLAVTQSEAAIQALFAKHPEWVTDKRTVKTPYGTVSARRTSKLSVANEEATILLIERRGGEAEEKFVKTEKKLDLEALEKLSDDELKAFRIVRVQEESLTIKEAKIDLGKAVKAAAEKEAA